MAKKRFGGAPAFYPYERTPSSRRSDEARIAHLIQLTNPVNEDGYRTRFDITEYARIHGRDIKTTEEYIEKLWEQGLVEVSEGRFIRLTKKGLELIGHS